MIRSILGTIAGIVVALVVISATDAINHALYPPPESIRAAAAKRDSPAIREAFVGWLPRAPRMSLVLIPVAWIAGSFCGALAASRIVHTKSLLPALVVGGSVFLGTIANLIMLPHPAWMAVTGLSGVLIAALAAWWLGPRSKSPRGPQPYDMRDKNMAC